MTWMQHYFLTFRRLICSRISSGRPSSPCMTHATWIHGICFSLSLSPDNPIMELISHKRETIATQSPSYVCTSVFSFPKDAFSSKPVFNNTNIDNIDRIDNNKCEILNEIDSCLIELTY